ncbi:hypothetical protein [Actinophytocola sp.]|uniref:hypothetical protein n=1 Tax=Actinophytocola sp. TaxID=1872138 RepID=UPI003D6C2D0A
MDHPELTADEVRRASFRSQIGGFAKRPVRDLLARVAVEIEAGRSPAQLTVTSVELPVKLRGYRIDDVTDLLTRLGITVQADPGLRGVNPKPARPGVSPLTSPTLMRDNFSGHVLDADDSLLGGVRGSSKGQVLDDPEGRTLLQMRPSTKKGDGWVVADAAGAEIGRIVNQSRAVGPNRRRYDLQAGATVIGRCGTRVLGNLMFIEDEAGTEIAVGKHRERLLGERRKDGVFLDTVWTLHQPLGEPLRSLAVCAVLLTESLFPPSTGGDGGTAASVGTGQ